MIIMKYTIRKYDGDDCYSWAIFHKCELPKGHRGPVFYGEATPIACGLSRSQAKHYKELMEAK